MGHIGDTACAIQNPSRALAFHQLLAVLREETQRLWWIFITADVNAKASALTHACVIELFRLLLSLGSL